MLGMGQEKEKKKVAKAGLGSIMDRRASEGLQKAMAEGQLAAWQDKRRLSSRNEANFQCRSDDQACGSCASVGTSPDP